ncbi:MAG TPA: hypothetical protein PK228_09010 [Saprospiraceae bacterium]|nr:hypothetical protein [Saprospiraceae bacterium]
MKQSISLFALFLFLHFSSQSQSAIALQDLEGLWYEVGRTAVCYSLWYRTDENTLHNRTFSIVCGDTIPLSTATIHHGEGTATMTLRTDSTGNAAPRTFRLARYDEDALVWENDDAQGTPRQIEWVFYGNNYCAFRADGAETGFRHKRIQPMQWRFRMSAGVNWSTYPAKRYGNQLGFSTDAEFERMSGQDLAFSAGLIFPETPLTLNFEVGINHRRVGVRSTLYYQEVWYNRDGVFEYFNTYFALMPELSIGSKKYLSISGGFYVGLAQMRDFRGTTTVTGVGAPNPYYVEPDMDVANENGLLAGISCRMPFLPQFQPTVYARYTQGMIDAHVRSASLGMSFQIARK